MNFKHLLTILLLGSIAFSCNNDEDTSPEGLVQFGFSQQTSEQGRTQNSDPAFISVTISDITGTIIFENEILELIDFNGEYLSEPLSLANGDYVVSGYLVLNQDNEVVYAAPIEGSELAHLVENPLPVEFSIATDDVTEVNIEVVSSDAGSGSQFGYATFGFNVTEYLQFQIAAFVYNVENTTYDLTEAEYEISSGGDLIISGSLTAATNTLTLPIKDDYSITISKESYDDYILDLTYSELESMTSDPIEVLLDGNGVASLFLQPDAENGKDAPIWTEEPDINYGDSKAFYALAWTWTGDGYNDGEYKSLIEFDVSSIPAGTTIYEAKLKLSFFEGSYFADLYHQFKTNEARLQRVTEAWDESTVTWNNQPAVTSENEILIESTIDQPYIDYEIDVTQLVVDQINNGNFGFLFSLQNSDYYRGVVLSSSDHEDETLHPALEIVYAQ